MAVRTSRRRPTLEAREARLAYLMLAPTFLIVLAVVLFPALANFWISFKPVSLADLRAPAPFVRERVIDPASEPGDVFTLRFDLRNPSPQASIYGVRFSTPLPTGLEAVTLDDRCGFTGGVLSCSFPEWEASYREVLELEFRAAEPYFAAGAPAIRADLEIAGRAGNILTDLTFTLENFRRLLSGPDFWPTLRITLIYTFASTIGSIVLGLFAAQLVNARFRGQGFLRGLFLFPYVAPVIAVAFVWAFFLDPFSGTVNALAVRYDVLAEPVNFLGQRSVTLSLFGLSFAFPLALSTVVAFSAWNYFPFAFLFILARFQAIPQDMYEAADVDGATLWQKFWWITVPQLTGILAVLFLLRVMFLINKFEDIFLLTGGAAGTKNLPVLVYDQAFGLANIGAGAAVAVVLFALLLVFMVIYFRFAPEER
jgi:multiple sugar transport system permease protein